MINNLKIKKKLMQLGLTSIALVNGALSLGCGRAVEASEEDIKEIISIIEAESTELVTATPEVAVTVKATLPHFDTTTRAPFLRTPEPTPIPTEEPTMEPSNPYDLTDEEAIEIGTYIYDNYIKGYTSIPGTAAHRYKSTCQLEDVINYVCILNQKYPALYQDRSSSTKDGDVYWYSSFCEVLNDANYYAIENYEKVHLFPFSTFLKDGRPEKELLEEMEISFEYISNNEVTNDDIYQYWGKVIKMSINADETFKNWHSFDLLLFYYTVYGQYGSFLARPQDFNYIAFNSIPADYVFENKKNVKLDIQDAAYYNSATKRQKYSGLTDDEYDSYICCFGKIVQKFIDENVDSDNYIKKRIKNGN